MKKNTFEEVTIRIFVLSIQNCTKLYKIIRPLAPKPLLDMHMSNYNLIIGNSM
jgi:hypothetical protein